MTFRDVGEMSNELEFSLHNTEASSVIKRNTLPLSHEVNPRDLIELNVSFAGNAAELNAAVEKDVAALIENAEAAGGEIYGGASLLEDVTDVEPLRYRTTSLSEACAAGLLDITSQQIVLGVTDEALGFELYNFFRHVNPALIALTASSPYTYRNGDLRNTGNASRRIAQYEQLCRYFPLGMWRNMPDLKSLDEYEAIRRKISDEVNEKLHAGQLDANWAELKKTRSNGNGNFSYEPFALLEPHQIYWGVRVRPDHCNLEKGGRSVFSLELRVPDMPTTVSRMQMLNALVAGLSYYIADHGNLPHFFDGSFDGLKIAAQYGLNASINGFGMRTAIENLRHYAAKGLSERGFSAECSRFDTMENVLTYGNDADLIRQYSPANAEQLRSYLICRLRDDE